MYPRMYVSDLSGHRWGSCQPEEMIPRHSYQCGLVVGNTKMSSAARWQSEEDNHKAGETWVTWSDMNPGSQKVDLTINFILQNPAPEKSLLGT